MGIIRSALGIERREFSLRRWQFWLDGEQQTDSGVKVSDAVAMTWSAVWGCVLVKSQDMAKTPLVIYRRLGRNGDKGREEAFNFHLHSIFRVAANPYMSAYMFKQVMQKHVEVRGNAYALIERDRNGISALWPRMPDRMEPVVNNGVLSYEYTENDGSRTVYPSEQIFHLRGLSNDGVVGLSPIEFFRNGIGLGLAYQQHAAKTFKHQARIPFAIEAPPGSNAETSKAFATSFQEAYGGAANAGKVPFLWGGMQIKPIGFTNRDAELISSEHFSVEEACRVWRVPPHKIMDYLRATFDNVAKIDQAYVNDSLRPHQENWEQEIRLKLMMPDEQRVYYAEHNNDDTLKGTPKERAEVDAILTQNGISNINEVRKGRNWNPVPEGDKNRTQMQMVPLDWAEKQPQAAQPQPKEA